MNSLYEKKLAIFSIVSVVISLYFYLLRALMENDFHLFIPTIIGTLPFIVFGLTIVVQNRRNIGIVKISVIGLLILWILLEIGIIVIFFLKLIGPLPTLIIFLYPLYPIYCAVKFFSVKNHNVNYTSKTDENV